MGDAELAGGGAMTSAVTGGPGSDAAQAKSAKKEVVASARRSVTRILETLASQRRGAQGEPLLRVLARCSLGVSVTLAVLAPRAAPADEVGVHADHAEIDLPQGTATLTGHVRLQAPPFTLDAEELRLSRPGEGGAISADSKQGMLAFCPCLGAPVAVGFQAASLSPNRDLVLKSARLELFGVPVLWVPWFLLRPPDQPGLLPPDISYRAADGLFLGGGVHLPWGPGTALDLRGGGYVEGGAAVDARLTTPSSVTRLVWDRLHGDDGFTAASRGAVLGQNGPATPDTAWDIDVIRGARGVAATPDVDAAARRYDRISAETTLRADGFTFSSGVRSFALRGGDPFDLGVVGPVASVRRGDALGALGTYDALVEGGALRVPADGTLAFARGEAGALFAGRAGPLGASVTLRGVGAALGDASQRGIDLAGSARAELTLPLVKGFASSEPNDPWVHRFEPRLSFAALGADTSGVVPGVFGRAGVPLEGSAWLASVGVLNAIGRWGAREGGELDVAGGVADSDVARALLRTRLSLTFPWVLLRAEGGHVFPFAADEGAGNAFALRARLGPERGLSATMRIAAREGVDPVLARALTDAPLEPSSGFFDAQGWTFGAGLAVPWTRSFITRGGTDWDFETGHLVAASAALEIHDPCGCLILRGNASQRIGRDGIDVWVSLDLRPH